MMEWMPVETIVICITSLCCWINALKIYCGRSSHCHCSEGYSKCVIEFDVINVRAIRVEEPCFNWFFMVVFYLLHCKRHSMRMRQRTSINFAIDRQTNRSHDKNQRAYNLLKTTHTHSTCYLNFECRSAPIHFQQQSMYGELLRSGPYYFLADRLNGDFDSTVNDIPFFYWGFRLDSYPTHKPTHIHLVVTRVETKKIFSPSWTT